MTSDGSSRRPPENPEPYRPLIPLARRAIEAALTGDDGLDLPSMPPPLDSSYGVFVTLWTADGQLRGCIGHMEAQYPSLAEEVARVAIASALSDTRFPPVTLSELASIEIELSVLHPLEPVDSRDQLDCRVYGVMVIAGQRRGVLLPDLDGVDTVDQQLEIACRKGGIRPGESFRVERFRVVKVRR